MEAGISPCHAQREMPGSLAYWLGFTWTFVHGLTGPPHDSEIAWGAIYERFSTRGVANC